jgi:hypothetical protein
MTEFESYEGCACMLHLSLCLEVTCNFQMYVSFEMFFFLPKEIVIFEITIILKTKYYIWGKEDCSLWETPLGNILRYKLSFYTEQRDIVIFIFLCNSFNEIRVLWMLKS